jgi:hypothetical protein
LWYYGWCHTLKVNHQVWPLVLICRSGASCTGKCIICALWQPTWKAQ